MTSNDTNTAMTVEQGTAVRSERPLFLGLLTIWFGLMTGYGEAAVLLFRRHVLHQLIWSSIDVGWMTPAAYLAFAIVPAAAITLIAFVAPRLVRLSHVTFLLAFVTFGVWSIVIFGGAIHVAAHIVLAAGLALQAARFATRRPARLRRVVLVSTPAAAGLCVLLVLGLPIWRDFGERRAIAHADAPAADAPNVLLIIWDTVRQQNLSLYGYERSTTPHLERRASEGVVFENALATAPYTLSTHASMFTGRLTQELSVGWRTPLDDRLETLAETLGDRGYRSAGFVANLIAASRESGLDQGFHQYHDFVTSPKNVLLHSLVGQRIRRPTPFNRGPLRTYPTKLAQQITNDFLGWQAEQTDRPFFAFLNYFDAHDPYYPPPDLARQFQSGRGLIDSYDAAIAHLDRELNRLFTELEQRGVLDNTLVVLASDHGELFGEKGLYQHGNSLYTPVLHVPLVIWRPGASDEGIRVSEPVSVRDLASTILEFTGVGAGSPFPGRSLSRFWSGYSGSADTIVAGVRKGIGTPPHEPVSRGNMSSVRLGSLYYILNGDGREELYDLSADPLEEVDLGAAGSNDVLLAEMRGALTGRVPASWRTDVLVEKN